MMQRLLLPFVALTISAAAAMAQEREWSWDETDTDAFLVFGTPNTDDVGVSFWCKLGSSSIKLFVPGLHGKSSKPERAAADTTVAGKHVMLHGTVSPNTDSGTYDFEAILKTSDPLFVQLEQAPYFHVEISGKKVSFPLDTANINDLIRACKGAVN